MPVHRPAARLAAIRFGLVAVISTVLPVTVHAQTPVDPSTGVWTLDVRLDHHDDAVPLRAHGDDDEVLRRLDPRPGRNQAWIDDELRLRHVRGHWSFGLLARSRLSVHVDAETLALVRHVDRDEPASPEGRHWRVDARATGYAGQGLALGWRSAAMRNDVSQEGASTAWFELQGLALTRWIDRRWAGQVSQAGGDGRYAVALQSWRRDDRLVEPMLPAPAGQGRAWLLAGGFRWDFAPTWELSGAVHDLGRLSWRGIVEEESRLSTDTALRDANGQVNVAPLMQGRVQARTLSASAPAWAELRLETRVTAHAGASAATRWGGAGSGWWRLGWRQAWSPDLALLVTALSPDWPVRRWGVMLQDGPDDTASWSISLAADGLTGSRRSMGLTLGWWLRP